MPTHAAISTLSCTGTKSFQELIPTSVYLQQEVGVQWSGLQCFYFSLFLDYKLDPHYVQVSGKILASYSYEGAVILMHSYS